ncbi:MAG: hypothetical protein WC666_02990 [Candidatus Paceibacterota bacterium]
MSKRQVIMLFGVWIMFFLFLGFPSAWDRILAVVTGLIIMIIAYRIPPQVKCCSDDCRCEEEKDVPFIEHKTESGISTAETINNNQL